MTYKDFFSSQAKTYAKYRPTYPDELFAFLANHSPGREVAYDVATGNGQSAVGLARHFSKVYASDASAGQIDHAVACPGVSYFVAQAEDSGLADGSVDLVTVAQALHWFAGEGFYREARRVLKPGGLLAAWSYGFSENSDPRIQPLLEEFSRGTLGPYWPAENAHIWKGYRELPFPFEELELPRFGLSCEWTLEELLGYFASWSATERFRKSSAVAPARIAEFASQLADRWGPPQDRRPFRWELALRVGRRNR